MTRLVNMNEAGVCKPDPMSAKGKSYPLPADDACVHSQEFARVTPLPSNAFVLLAGQKLWLIAPPMSAHPNPEHPAREVIAPPHVSLKKEVGRETGPQPLEYGEVRLWLVAKAPQQLFAYWEFRPDEHPEAKAGDGPPRFFLRIICEATDQVEATLEIEPNCGKCTAAVAAAEAQYRAEIGFFNEQGVWCFLARSGLTRTPPTDGTPIATPRRDPLKPQACMGQEWSPAQESRLNHLLAEDVAEKSRPLRSRKRPRK